MEVRAICACIAAVADLRDHLAALHHLPFVQTRRVGQKVRVVVDPLLVGGADIDRRSATNGVEQFLDRKRVEVKR